MQRHNFFDVPRLFWLEQVSSEKLHGMPRMDALACASQWQRCLCVLESMEEEL